MSDDIILIVDDEESVRRTFADWLKDADLGCRVLSAGDAEAALEQANREPIDLAILDWNLGAGDDGLQLLQDLALFHPDIVAILITGYANQATPLDAMRMGVRDYLDKNADLTRETFLKAVRRQLDQLRPAKRVRQLHQSLIAFREAVEKVLPLVQSAGALSDPVPLPEAIRSLVRFVRQVTHATAGVLLVRSYDAERQPPEVCKAYDSEGQPLTDKLLPFANSLAGSAMSMQETCVLNDLKSAGVTLQPFERDHQNLLAAPMAVAPGVQVVLELFDKAGGFAGDDQRLVKAASDLGAELLRQALGQRRQHQLLLDAVGAALGASDQMAQTLHGTVQERAGQPPAVQIFDQLRQGLSAAGGDRAASERTLQLAEAIRVLGLRHGPAALDHCLHLVEQVQQLLETVAGPP